MEVRVLWTGLKGLNFQRFFKVVSPVVGTTRVDIHVGTCHGDSVFHVQRSLGMITMHTTKLFFSRPSTYVRLPFLGTNLIHIPSQLPVLGG